VNGEAAREIIIRHPRPSKAELNGRTHNMSSKDRSIRVIKRAHRESLVYRETPVAPVKTESQTKRELLKTIESWIEEQRETKKVS